MGKELKCPICGKETNNYNGRLQEDGLCRRHWFDFFNGVIYKGNDGLFYDPIKGKILNADYKAPVSNDSAEMKEESNDSIVRKCIICENDTKNGRLFCLDCYKKYVNKQILVKIERCKNISLMNIEYEGFYKCKDGHVVKSKSEMIIDDFLYDHRIVHAYETAIIPDDDCEYDYHPDFMLPNYNGKGDVYIEHWGRGKEDKAYTELKNNKIDYYNKKGYTIISTYEKDMANYVAALTRKLKHFEVGKVNYSDEDQ